MRYQRNVSDLDWHAAIARRGLALRELAMARTIADPTMTRRLADDDTIAILEHQVRRETRAASELLWIYEDEEGDDGGA